MFFIEKGVFNIETLGLILFLYNQKRRYWKIVYHNRNRLAGTALGYFFSMMENADLKEIWRFIANFQTLWTSNQAYPLQLFKDIN